jgi:Na+/H+-dicarboxylate symporter
VLFFPLSATMALPSSHPLPATELHLLENLPSLLTVSQFGALFSTGHMLALIIFSMLMGLAAKTADKSGAFIACLQSGEAVFIQLFSVIMKLAPIGFFAYFATIVHDLGTQFIANYVHVIVLYYLASIVYFFAAYSFYAYLAGGVDQVRSFWSNVLIPSLTAIATCSSAATIPANAEALKKMQVPSNLAETIIPLGTILHKQGSIMGGVIKIAFLYGLFHLNFFTLPALCGAVGVSLLVGTVMGAIPSGGMLGELLILHVYGFPPSSLFLIATISLLIDPPATLLNVTGNTIAGVLFNRFNRS